MKVVVKREDIKNVILNLWNLQVSKATKFRSISAILLASTSGLRAEEVYRLSKDDIDLAKRRVCVKAENSKDLEDRVTFFSKEAQVLLSYFLEICDEETPFNARSIRYLRERYPDAFKINQLDFQLKLCRKFFSQQSDRLGMPTAVKKILMGHSTRNDIDLSHYDFQDEEELRKIYDRYWRDFKIA